MADARDLRLQVILGVIDKALAPLRKITGGSNEAAKALKAARDQLKDVNRAQEDMRRWGDGIEKVKALSAAVEAAKAKTAAYNATLDEHRNRHVNVKAALKTATHDYDQLAAGLLDGKGQTAEFTRQLELARIKLLSAQQATERSLSVINNYKQRIKNAGDEVHRLGAQHTAAAEQTNNYRERLERAGVDVDRLGQHTARLAADEARLTAEVQRQRAALDAQRESQQRLTAAHERHRKSQELAGKLATAGAVTGATGLAVKTVVGKSVKAYSKMEDAMLGIARQVPGARTDAGQLTDVYRDMQRQIYGLGREIPLTTTEIADMVTAGARMEVPTEALREYTKTAAMMAIAFEQAPAEIAESMGKVGKNFKIPITQIAGLADAINYLDDNAISKGGDIINVLNRISGVVSTVAMSASDAAALSSTLLTLGETRETAATAINAITQKFAAAEKGTKKFKSALKEVGLSTHDVQHGMATDATATLQRVVAAVAKLPKEKRIGVMVELVGLEHSDTLAKLVDKPEEFKRQLDLTKSDRASGSMSREAAARSETLSAQYVMAQNRAFELASTLGEKLRPALVDIMNVVNRVLEAVTGWVDRNPELASTLMIIVTVGGALLVVIGGLLVAAAAIVSSMAVTTLGLALMGTTTGAVAGAVGLLLGKFALLAAAFYAGYEFGGLLNSGLNAVMSAIMGTDTSLGSFIYDLVNTYPARMRDAGAALLAGMVAGITGTLGTVRDAIMGAADSVVGWFKERLGIHSPSRVFALAGAEISNGAAAGIDSRAAHVRRAVLAMAAAAATAMPDIAGAAPGGPAGVRIDTRPPISTSAPGRAGAAPAGGGHTIVINPPAGVDAREIARMVSAELDRRDRERGAARRASLSDNG